MNQNIIKYAYLRDYYNNKRVFTLARKLVSSNTPHTLIFHVGYAINSQVEPTLLQAFQRVQETIGYNLPEYKKLLDQCDSFDKKEGRIRAIENMEENPFVVKVYTVNKPHVFYEIINALLSHPVYYVREISYQWIRMVEFIER